MSMETIGRAGDILVRMWRGKLALWMLLCFLVATFFLLLFAYLASEVSGGDARRFDETFLLFFRSNGNVADPIGPAWLEGAVRDVTSLGSYTIVVLVSLVAVFYLLMRRSWRGALLVGLSVLGGIVLSNVLKFGFARPRPELVPPAVEVFSNSFPSGHAILSAVTYLTLGALLAELHASRWIRLYFLSLAFLIVTAVGLSRIYLGVHYPTDVLAGWCIGAAWALWCRALMLWHQRGSAA